jgi:NAD(P)H-quinone oxidoreductase subunit 5
MEWLFFQLMVTLHPFQTGLAAYLWLTFIFSALFLGHRVLEQKPNTRWGRKLYIWLFAGLYLDEWVTRTCLKIGPLQASDFESTPITQKTSH